MTEGLLRLTRKWPEGAAVAALRDIDAVSHKNHRAACRRINQCFLKKTEKTIPPALSSNENLLQCDYNDFRGAADTYRRSPQTITAGSDTHHVAELFTAVIQQVHTFRYEIQRSLLTAVGMSCHI